MKLKIGIVAILCVVSLTTMAQLKLVESGVYPWSGHTVKTGADRESRKVLEGTSTHLDYFEVHITTQFPGSKPNKAHDNENIEDYIIVTKGLMKLTIEDRSVALGPEGVALVLPKQMHSVQNIGTSNLTYFVVRLRSKKNMDLERGIASGGSLMLNADSLPFKPSARGGGRAYFDRATAMCDHFELHVTQLAKKGPSHDPHAHEETQIILILSGSTEMTIDGKEYTAGVGDFYLVNSQLKHGVRNATDEPCHYVAFKWK